MSNRKRVMITGANSYIGDAVKSYLEQYPEYTADVISTNKLEPAPELFCSYDVVFNVAGIVHMKEKEENKHLYYEVNRDLVINIAKAAKKSGAKQFILLSSMSVYGKNIGHITKKTVPKPVNAYGESKLDADMEVQKLEDKDFKVACLRPPMVYGKGCKGNYQKLRKIALNFPVFPNYVNQRSMIYIGNLCEFIKKVIDEEKSGLFFPQNAKYVNTAEMVRLIAQVNNVRISTTSIFNWAIKIAPMNMVKKAFGSLTYELVDTVEKYNFTDSIKLTEK